MKRRGNKSNKVPNVKLRPADKSAYAHPVIESCWAEDTQTPADDLKAFVDTCPRPMTDVVICATGITDKPTLFKQAVELGATCTLAFTDRVTHLIAVDHGGAKYMCALERKIPIVKPSWITENYQIWLRGDDDDVEATLTSHRLPIFSGVVVCPSGITDITRRTQIAKLVAQHDGAYLKNLERPVRVTHLLCSGDEETDKMRYAEKFNQRGEATIHLVWEEWFWDCLDFGGRFQESGYAVRQPRPERRTTMVPQPGPPPSSSLPSRFDEGPSSSAPKHTKAPQNQNQNQNTTAAAANADDMDDEPAFAKVLPNVTLQLWGNLLGRRGYQVTDGEIILSPSKVAAAAGDRGGGPPSPSSPTEHEPQPEKAAFGAARSVISSFRRTNSFAPQETSTGRQVPFRRTATAGGNVFASAVAGPSRLPAQAQARAQPPAPGAGKQASTSKAVQPEAEAPIQPQIFAGLRIRPMGEARGASVRAAIEARGGLVVGGDEADDGWDEVDYVVVRLVSGSKLFLQEDSPALRLKYRTECWLEQCLYEDRVCAPAENVAFVPLGVETPVPGAEGVVFSFSGFEEAKGHALRRLGRALGITLAPTFNRRATHLLCPSGTGLKFDKALEWGVPVVHMGWLEEMARTGRVPEAGGFLVSGPLGADESGGAVEREAVIPPVVGKALDKGKGRAVPVGGGENVESAAKKQKQQQPKSLGREATTIIPNDPPQQEGGSRPMLRSRTASTFDNSGYYVHPSSIPTQSRLPSVPPVEFGEGFESEETGGGGGSNHQMFVPDRSFSLHSLQQQQQQLLPQLQQEQSQLELEAEKSNPNFRIPSSKSPSPLKLRIPGAPLAAAGTGGAGATRGPEQTRQMRRTNSRGMSLSPVKIDHEAAKALQESITSLLGKRPSGDADDATYNNGNGNGKGAKRARPQRNKAQSRQVSDANIDISAPAGGLGAGAKGKGVAGKATEYASVSAISAFESYEESNHPHPHGGRSQVRMEMQVEEESMRVLYEDPGQRLEKQRLMDLLKSQNGEEDSIVSAGSGSTSSSYTRKSTRRSARIAG
ncbi:hypothetical protein D9619_004296 [Psilocybe cf. subviscida]|uniref:BRCT domain-containing protein n=1 Tax=Psilocybe cf. subviscida TaxID=2480587 RepID=A0A8H5BPN4_9AGAR|nr:hypothetical protein D9619_004296 [Psilocybe cf. subviscida]